ncbi:MAG: carboxypeptidase regulatory-like domain-containing protein [Planctomycetes bacterium]|nr:carboxypeptidase regulatory-like domain-containing protein [Planctomycetota bacterium]
MQGNSRNAALSLIVALVVAGGVWLLGGFDSDGADGTGGTKKITGEGYPTEVVAQADSNDGNPIKTQRFSAENGTESARVETRVTGIRLRGEVRSADNELLPDATARLIRDVSQIRGRFQEGVVVAQTKTKKNGRFAFEDLGPGEVYILRVGHVDFTTERVHPIDSSIPATLRQVVRLGNGVAIKGVVKDESGAPIDEARVEIFDVGIGTINIQPEPEKAVETGPDGRFEGLHLRAGVKKVLVHKAGYASDGKSAVDLRQQGVATELTFTLSRGRVITGIVTDRQSGEPVAGAQVTARPLSYLRRQVTRPRPVQGTPDVAGRVGEARIGESAAPRVPRAVQPARPAIVSKSFLVANAITDEEGRFELLGVLEARYTLRVFARGFNRTHGRTVDAGSLDVEVQLTRSPSILGRVVDSETGEPVTRFTIASSPQPNPMYLPPHTKQRFTDREDGSFEYLDARAGKQHLLVQAEGYAGGRSEPLQVDASAGVAGVVIEMVRGAKVSGKLVGTDAAPVSGAEVSLLPGRNNNLPPNPFTDAISKQLKLRGSRRAMTDRQGRFSFDNVLGGKYRVSATHGDYADMESPEVEIADSGSVEVGPFSMARGGVIEGFVKTASGDPDPRAQVMVSSVGGSGAPTGRSQATDTEGFYRVKGLLPGTYRVIAAQREGTFRLDILLDPSKSGARTVTIADGETVRVDF